MSFDTDLTDSLLDLFTIAGQEATLIRCGVETPCHADVIKGVDLQPSGFFMQVSGNSTVIEFLLSEIVTEPDRNDTVIVGTTVYTVESIAENDGYTVKVVVKQEE